MRNDLPRLELTEDPNKNNEYIIYRYPSKGVKPKQSNSTTQKHIHKKKHSTKKNRTAKRNRTTKRNMRQRKGFFNIFT
jgi:hypothetical protein